MRRGAAAIAVVFVCVVTIGACGSSNGCGPSCLNAGGNQAPRPPIVRPGCGQFCQSAAPGGGPSCMTAAGVCPPCRPQCLTVLSSSAKVVRGAIPVRVRCGLQRACTGAFLVLAPGGPPSPSGTPMKDWIAGSDLNVPAHQTTTVFVAVTPRGEQLARAPGGYRGDVTILLRGYEYVQTAQGAGPTLLVHG